MVFSMPLADTRGISERQDNLIFKPRDIQAERISQSTIIMKRANLDIQKIHGFTRLDYKFQEGWGNRMMDQLHRWI
jgi:hypothetical protein